MWRSAVQLCQGLHHGGIAQLVEHLLCKQRVQSSNLCISTTPHPRFKTDRSNDWSVFLLCSGRSLIWRSPSLSRGPQGPFFSLGESRKNKFSVSPIRKKMPHIRAASTVDFGSAERARFELAKPFRSLHAFQACLLSHSSISPVSSVHSCRAENPADRENGHKCMNNFLKCQPLTRTKRIFYHNLTSTRRAAPPSPPRNASR